MLKLVKFLKQSITPIIAIVILLVVQAYCDLSLPSYTSDIVNIGIQQGGVNTTVPDAIRKSEIDKMSLFLTEPAKEQVLVAYSELNEDNFSKEKLNKLTKEYPLSSNESVYLLTEKDETKLEELASIFEQVIPIVSMLESDSEMAVKFQEQLRSNLPPEAKDLDIFTVLSSFPKEQLTSISESFGEKLSEMPESIMRQSSISYVKNELETIGFSIEGLQRQYIMVTGAKMLGLAFLAMLAAIIVTFLASRVAASLSRRLRSEVFHKVVSFSSTEFDKFSTASLITRSTNDIQQVQMLIVMLFRIVIYAPILAIGGVFKVLNTNTSMAWILAVGVGAILTVVIVLFNVAMPKFKSMQKLVDKLNLVTREIISGLPVIRAFSTQKHEEKRFDMANKDLTRTQLFVNRAMTFMMPTMMLIMNLITLLIVWVGAKGIDAGNMQVGDMMAFIQYTMQIIMSFLMITMISIMLPRASVSATRIDEILSTKPVLKEKEKPVSFDDSKKGLVEFNHVSFRYPGADEDVLSDINFTAKPGQMTAIIGSTGSGKSTLIHLIPRFYDITEGELLIEGKSITDVSLHDLRDKIGFVPQKGVLFSGTIESNIGYGVEEISQEELTRAARIAQATEFIDTKPEGYATDIAQGGGNVSGGQKQRLSIARAIAKRPDILIFDDSFSALDYQTDAKLRKALFTEMKDSTIIVVAQRISTILYADQILVLDEGKVVGKGTHKELLKSCDVYKQIAISQFGEDSVNASLEESNKTEGGVSL